MPSDIVIVPAHPGGERQLLLSNVSEVHAALTDVREERYWIVFKTELLHQAFRSFFEFRPSVRQHLLLVDWPNAPPRLESARWLLDSFFSPVAAAEPGAKLLPADELVEVLQAPNRADYFIGVAADTASQHVLLRRGNLESLAVPFAWFTRRQNAHPDFANAAVTDFGQTVRFGNHEVAADAILYEFDPKFRRRAKRRLREQDESFGGSLRRLRLLRGLSQDRIQGVSAKEIARIEKSKVKPRRETLQKIAEALRVAPDEISSY